MDAKVVTEGFFILAAGVGFVGIGTKASRVYLAKVDIWLIVHDPVGKLGSEAPTHQQPAAKAFS